MRARARREPPTRVVAMPASDPSDRPSARRSSARTAVVWEALLPLLEGGGALDVLDVGGGTGGFAVRVAELGHRVRVVDPSPDALAALDRRAREREVSDRVTGQQGDLSTLLEVTAARQRRPGAVPRGARGGRRPRRRPGHPRRGAAAGRHPQPARRPAARRGGGPGHGRPLRPGPASSSTTPATPAVRVAGSPPTRSPRCCAGAGLEPRLAARRPGLLRPGPRLPARPRARRGRGAWSSSSVPWRAGRSTSRWPPRCTCSRVAEGRAAPCPAGRVVAALLAPTVARRSGSLVSWPAGRGPLADTSLGHVVAGAPREQPTGRLLSMSPGGSA